jgi:hypothetical protein
MCHTTRGADHNRIRLARKIARRRPQSALRKPRTTTHFADHDSRLLIIRRRTAIGYPQLVHAEPPIGRSALDIRKAPVDQSVEIVDNRHRAIG